MWTAFFAFAANAVTRLVGMLYAGLLGFLFWYFSVLVKICSKVALLCDKSLPTPVLTGKLDKMLTLFI